MAIIIDNKDFEDPSSVIMSDDGTGSGIGIPAILISETDGEKLKAFLSTSDKETAAKAAISADFIQQN